MAAALRRAGLGKDRQRISTPVLIPNQVLGMRSVAAQTQHVEEIREAPLGE